MPTRAWALAAAAAVTALLMLATSAWSRPSASLVIDVTFSTSGTISVTLPDGTPVGTTAGAPTLVPAGYYMLVFSGPQSTTGLPYFHLTGPGADILQNLNEGGTSSARDTAYLAPGSTYTWTDDALPGVTYTFTTSTDVVGTAPATPTSPDKGAPAGSQDIVGSEVTPLRGRLSGVVSPTGRLTLADGGKPVSALRPGRYSVTVTDLSRATGFVLGSSGRKAVTVTGRGFVGKRSLTVDLTSGRWWLATPTGSPSAAAIIVR